MSPEHLSPIYPVGFGKIVTIASLFDVVHACESTAVYYFIIINGDIIFFSMPKLGINEGYINICFQIPQISN